MFKGPERMGGGSNYCFRVVFVLLAIFCMLAYLLYFFYVNHIVDRIIH